MVNFISPHMLKFRRILFRLFSRTVEMFVSVRGMYSHQNLFLSVFVYGDLERKKRLHIPTTLCYHYYLASVRIKVM